MNKMENVFYVIIPTFGITIKKNVKLVLPHIFMTNKEENACVHQVNHLILVWFAFNVYSQAIGILIKEDVYNAQANRFIIVWKDIVNHVLKMPLSLKIMNVTHVLKIATMIEPEWYALYVLKDKFTII